VAVDFLSSGTNRDGIFLTGSGLFTHEVGTPGLVGCSVVDRQEANRRKNMELSNVRSRRVLIGAGAILVLAVGIVWLIVTSAATAD
jgi:hypothetical protein